MEIENMIETHYAGYLSKAKDELIKKMEAMDFALLKSKTKNLVVKDIRERMIWTPQTDILRYRRRRYLDRNSGKYRYLLDEHLKIEKHKFISTKHQKMAMECFPFMRSYSAIANVAFNGRVSKMSIHNFIKNFKDDYKMSDYSCNNDGILWINADGLWVKENKSTKSREIKNFVFFTGRNFDKHTKRWVLEGRTIKHFISEPPNVMYQRLSEIIGQYDGVREIRVVGDGANWIKNFTKNINGIYYIDKFHYHKAIDDLLGRKSKRRAYIFQLLKKEVSKKAFRKELIKVVANPSTGEVSNKQQTLIGYLVNNIDHYIRNAFYDNPINCIEAIQAHYQARYLKGQRKGWSLEVLDKVITFMNSKSNKGWSLSEESLIPNSYEYKTYGSTASVPGIQHPIIRRSFGLG